MCERESVSVIAAHQVCVYQGALGWAVEAGHIGTVRLLLQSKADVDATDEERWTPLIIAAHHGHVGVTELLIEHEANPVSVHSSAPTDLTSRGITAHHSPSFKHCSNCCTAAVARLSHQVATCSS